MHCESGIRRIDDIGHKRLRPVAETCVLVMMIVADPGKHTYWTTGEATDTLNMELEPDETYFVRCSIGMGIMSGRAQVSPSDRAAFAAKAKGMKLWEKKEEKDK